ncbi:MAG: carbohydrate ABC transporter permease [Bacillota bacterium]
MASDAAAATAREKKIAASRIAKFAWYAVMTVIGLVFAVPFLWVLGSSFKFDNEIFRFVYPLSIRTFVPQIPTLKNYMEIFVELGIGRSLLNSLFVAGALAAGTLAVTSLAAYAFARLDFPGKNALFIGSLSTMFVPFEAVVVPLYLVTRFLGMRNTLSSLVIPWLSSPFGVFLLRQFITDIPRELDEAAMIDGCSTLGIYWNIILPNAKPALVTLGLIQFLAGWDAFFWPLVVITSPKKQVIQVAIASLTTREMIFWGRTFAACTVAVLPVLVLFLFLQKYYIEGVTMTGIKG